MSPAKKKIVYVTGTRADFGLMTPVLNAIEKSKKLSLQVYATGMQLMPEFGWTVREVRKAFPKTAVIDARFETDDRRGMAAFASTFLPKITTALEKDKPALALLLGDRPETLCAALASLYLGIPTAHLHGGEKTGTVDELARHAITKLASLHFPATRESALRIRRLGEEGWRIHVVGAPAFDTILHGNLPSRTEALTFLSLPPRERFILVAQHSVSEEWKDAGEQMKATLDAVTHFKLPAVVVYPNADAGGRRMIAEIEREKNNPLFRIFPSVPYTMFLAFARDAAVWVGNSSAALIESAAFKTPVVNVGTRQTGRQRGENVIAVGYHRNDIIKAVERSLYDKKYLAGLTHMKNPWGDGRTAARVVTVLERFPDNQKLLAKQIVY